MNHHRVHMVSFLTLDLSYKSTTFVRQAQRSRSLLQVKGSSTRYRVVLCVGWKYPVRQAFVPAHLM
jgi:hypothetical protein